MRLLSGLVFLFFASLPPASAATLSVCGSGCTYTNAQLQTALNTAASGDTIVLEAGHTYDGNYTFKNHGCTMSQPVLVTTSRTEWLPAAGTRVNPSHLPNMPLLRTINSDPVMAGVLTAGVPANCWHFVGVAFTSSAAFTFQLINLKNAYTAAGAEQLATDILFDRCYIFSQHDNSKSIQSAIRAETRALTVINSFFDDLVAPGFENHAIDGITVEGPWTIENNFFTVGSIPVFTGGGKPDYDGVHPKNVSVRFNYLGKLYKWWGTNSSFSGASYNPYYADYLANGSVNPCLKNNGEFKTIDTVIWQYNVHELSPGSCQSQSNGLTLTPRTEWGPPPGSTATIAAASPVLTYTGADHPELAAGKGVCAITDTNPDVAYCGTIQSFDTNANTITIEHNFDATGSGLMWILVFDPQLVWKNVSILDNVFRESANGLLILGLDPSPGNATGAGVATNLTIRNNLFINERMPMGAWIKLTAGPPFLMHGVTSYTNGITVENNTLHVAAGLPQQSQWLVSADDLGAGTFFNGFTIRNNLGPGGEFGFFGSGVGQGSAVVNSFFAANAVVRNNTTPGMNWSCSGGRTCTGNITGSFSNQWANAQTVQKLLPSSDYAKKGTDGRDLGADFDRLPLIKNLKAEAGHNRALLKFDLSAPISSIPCVLEVSASRNLHSELGNYTVLSDLNPSFFKQPEVSNRANPKLLPVLKDGARHQWAIGGASGVVGDDGVSHDLSLTPGTTYYGRLQCGGDLQRFEFRTAAQASAATSFTVKVEAPSGTTSVVVEYGSTPALGNESSATPDGSLKAEVSIPMTAGAHLFYRLLYKNGAATTYTGPLQIRVF